MNQKTRTGFTVCERLSRPSLYPVPGLQVQVRAARLSPVLSATDQALAVLVTVTVPDVTVTVQYGPRAGRCQPATVTFKSDSDTGTGSGTVAELQ